jgi:hypothetical protein
MTTRRASDIVALLRQYDPSGNLVAVTNADVASDKSATKLEVLGPANYLAMPPK